jgi:hypothetical protein
MVLHQKSAKNAPIIHFLRLNLTLPFPHLPNQNAKITRLILVKDLLNSGRQVSLLWRRGGNLRCCGCRRCRCWSGLTRHCCHRRSGVCRASMLRGLLLSFLLLLFSNQYRTSPTFSVRTHLLPAPNGSKAIKESHILEQIWIQPQSRRNSKHCDCKQNKSEYRHGEE